MAVNRRVVWCSMLLFFLYLSLGRNPALQAKWISPFSVTESTPCVGDCPKCQALNGEAVLATLAWGEKFYPIRLDRLVVERLNIGYLAINRILCLGVIRKKLKNDLAIIERVAAGKRYERGLS